MNDRHKKDLEIHEPPSSGTTEERMERLMEDVRGHTTSDIYPETKKMFQPDGGPIKVAVCGTGHARMAEIVHQIETYDGSGREMIIVDSVSEADVAVAPDGRGWNKLRNELRHHGDDRVMEIQGTSTDMQAFYQEIFKNRKPKKKKWDKPWPMKAKDRKKYYL